MIKLRVMINPLQCSIGREQFAIMKTSWSFNKIICWSSHIRRLQQSLSFIRVILISEILPNPKRTFIKRSQVITYDKFFSILVVSFNSFIISFFQSPIQSLLIYISTSKPDFICLVEISMFIASLLLNCLSRHHLGLHFKSSNWIFSSVKNIINTIIVFGHCNAVERTMRSSWLLTSVVKLRQVHRCYGVHSMKIVLWFYIRVVVRYIITHKYLCLFWPRSTL